MVEMINSYNIQSENLNGRYHFGGISVDERIILTWI
jgi:hypothetical protein